MDPVAAAALALFLLRKGKEAYDEMMTDHSAMTAEQFLVKWAVSATTSIASREAWEKANAR